MFCVILQNNQHCFEKYYEYLEVNCLRNSKITLKFNKPSNS